MPQGELPRPAEFPHGPAGVPDLGHVADLAVLELHHVDIVGAGALAGWGHRAAVAAVGAREHGVGGDVFALMVGGEGLDRVARVREDNQHSLHPVGVLLKRLHVGERLRLRREARVWLAVGAAHGPAFARLAGVEKGSCRLGDGLGGGGHGLTPSPSCRFWTRVRSKKVRPMDSLPPSVTQLYARTAPLQSAGTAALRARLYGPWRPAVDQRPAGVSVSSRCQRMIRNPYLMAVSSRARASRPSGPLGMATNRPAIGLAAVMTASSRSTWSASLTISGRARTSLPRSRIRSGRPSARLSFQFPPPGVSSTAPSRT